jgi:hypothetical protein
VSQPKLMFSVRMNTNIDMTGKFGDVKVVKSEIYEIMFGISQYTKHYFSLVWCPGQNKWNGTSLFLPWMS